MYKDLSSSLNPQPKLTYVNSLAIGRQIRHSILPCCGRVRPCAATVSTLYHLVPINP